MIAAVVGVIIIGGGTWFWKNSKTEPATIAQSNKESSISAKKDSEIIKSKDTYADGTYSAIGNYTSPAGEEQVVISLTLKDETITNTEFTGKATHPASKKWQEIFSAGYKEKVIGKSINELSLVAVSGASLATKGFMDALEEIKQQAGK